MRTILLALAFALAVVVVVLTANFLLLGVAVKRNDPVGRLLPVANLGHPAARLPSAGGGGRDDHPNRAAERGPDD